MVGKRAIKIKILFIIIKIQNKSQVRAFSRSVLYAKSLFSTYLFSICFFFFPPYRFFFSSGGHYLLLTHLHKSNISESYLYRHI